MVPRGHTSVLAGWVPLPRKGKRFEGFPGITEHFTKGTPTLVTILSFASVEAELKHEAAIPSGELAARVRLLAGAASPAAVSSPGGGGRDEMA